MINMVTDEDYEFRIIEKKGGEVVNRRVYGFISVSDGEVIEDQNRLSRYLSSGDDGDGESLIEKLLANGGLVKL